MKYLILLLIGLTVQPLLAQRSDDVQLANEYYVNGELEKAGDLYAKLATKTQNISAIHNNYFSLLLELKNYKVAEKYLKRAIKAFPKNVNYQIDEGVLQRSMDQVEESNSTFEKVIEKHKTNEYYIRLASQYFLNKRYYEFSQKALLASREHSNKQDKHALELANVYRFLGDKNNMINEYLLYAKARPNNLSYIKNIMQSVLKDDEDIENLQRILIENIQLDPDEIMYSDLLIWVHLQRKNFYGAFIQSRSIDRRFNEGGKRLIDIGKIALKNSDYENAVKIFQYVVDNSTHEKYYLEARRYVLASKEEKVKSQYPLDMAALSDLAGEYQKLVDEQGYNRNTLEAYRKKALLHAYYLDHKDSAVAILNNIIAMPRANTYLKSECKLDLGDIYLLIEEPWEATLLYSQVEKAHKDSRLAYTAKLKNAKLNYFKGEFELAKSHLDILKLATTREIANDAISLSLLIQNNTVFDTSDYVMKEFASIELLLFQNKKSQAIERFTEMLTKYPNHSLTDEVYWKRANINLVLGKFNESIDDLELIQTQFGHDILGDDAMYLMGKIYEEQLGDFDRAQEVYNEFLLRYPGSVFTAEARKKFRKLRGDINF